MIIWFVLSNLWAFDCKDYDAGKDSSKPAATVTTIQTCVESKCVSNKIIERDTCVSEKQVLEYYCKGSEAVAIVIDCESPTTCSDGYCH